MSDYARKKAVAHGLSAPASCSAQHAHVMDRNSVSAAYTESAWRRGHLVIVGGREDRRDDMNVLTRFVELCGGASSTIVVLTAATALPGEAWNVYDRAFGELGVSNRVHMSVSSRDDADHPAYMEKILAADGVFMTGGEQKRLLALVGASGIESAMHRAFREQGACIGGTSAGASAMSAQMLANGSRDKLPDRNTAHLANGLGFLPGAVIDQHFSERQRLARLLSAIVQHPGLVGVGIDEDTALVIQNNGLFEVVGAGAVTLLDGRQMTSNLSKASAQDHLELINVKLHLLPAGASYRLTPVDASDTCDDVPPALREILSSLIRT